jgi:hypothetical protein
VWLASHEATGVHDQRIVATEFNEAAASPALTAPPRHETDPASQDLRSQVHFWDE